MIDFHCDITYGSRMAAWLAVLSALLVAGCLPARASDGEPVVVRFTQQWGHIFLKATIDGQVATLMLDTGAGVDLVTPEAAKRLNLKRGKDVMSVIGAGGSVPPVSTAVIGELKIGRVRLEQQPVALIPLPAGFSCDGVLGTPFLQQWAVTIDYAKSTLTLTPPACFTPPAGATPFALDFASNTPHIEATVDGWHGWFQLDTGAQDAVTLFAPFVEKHRLGARYPFAARTDTGHGVGGKLHGRLVRLAELDIGWFRFEKPMATLSLQGTGAFADDETAGNLGAELLKRFTVTVDYPNRRVYLVPSAQYDIPFVLSRSGLAIDYLNGALVVRFVLRDSPGAEAGVKIGDTVVAIDDRPAAQMQLGEADQLLLRAPGTRVHLQLRSADGTHREANMKLRGLF